MTQTYNGKTIDELSDAEVLQLYDGGRFGPAIIGQELYERGSRILLATDNGRFGPAILDPDYSLNITPWDDYSRKELLVACRTYELPVKSNATREELAKALVRAKRLPEQGPGTGEGAE
jgi:hypothetical protein